MGTTASVQPPEAAVCILRSANNLKQGINPIIHPLDMGQ